MKNFNNLEEHYGKEITVQGFISSIRDLQYVQFLVLRNGIDKLQITIEKNSENAILNGIVTTLNLESTIKVTGKLTENPKVKLNGRELIPSGLEIISKSKEVLPINLLEKEKTLRETRLDYRFLDLRREENNLLFRCQTLVEKAMRDFCIGKGFIEIHSPKISAAAAESGAEVFKLDYFGQNACLSQSPQFYKQMAMVSGFNNVFEIGPAFRAEDSHTSYHAAEINMADFEMSWIDSVEDVMDHEEEMLKYVINELNKNYGEEIKNIFGVTLSNVDASFPRITIKEAKHILKSEYKYDSDVADLDRKEEELLCKYAKEKYNSDFIFITKYPFEARPFYHMVDEDGLTNSFDLLYKSLEITTGAQREHRYDILKNQIISKGINPEELTFYLEFFEYGCPQHGGYAIGIARLMMLIFDIDNIREATFIYRGPTRLNP